MPPGDGERFADLNFEDFRRLALDQTLSPHERIGFPDEYRAGFEDAILADIVAKIPTLLTPERCVLDIGAGAGELARRLRDHCREHDHTLIFVDSPEMLDHHEAESGLVKLAGRFPDCPELLADYAGRIDAIISYSVMQYVFAEGNVFDFVDRVLALLAPGGRALIGDLPNASMRRRFFASAAGREHHRGFAGADTDPPHDWGGVLQPGRIDDAVVLGLLARARAAGFHAYVMPQATGLPMANRREDVLIVSP